MTTIYPCDDNARIAWIRENLDNALASGQRRRYLEAILASHQREETMKRGWPCQPQTISDLPRT